jgi:thiamine-monophosphate kinase
LVFAATGQKDTKTYSEAQLIERISAAIPTPIGAQGGPKLRSRVGVAIGDDAAVISPNGESDWVLSSDAFLEGIHFLPKTCPSDSVGYKSLVRATSDLAAMGATPRLFLLTLALPADRTRGWLDGFLQGMGKAVRQLGIRLVGGDTTKAPLVLISITVLGEVPKGCAVTRSGARPGDLIYVSGKLGRAQLGYELLRHARGATPRYRRLVEPHLYPEIRLKLGAWLARQRLASAMMDLSDGLSTDLARLCDSSKVGARLFESRIPRVQIREARPPARWKLDPLQMALHGGEDYELLFTVPPGNKHRLAKAPGFEELAEIGEITRDKAIVLSASGGHRERLKPQGWDPFRKPSLAGIEPKS